MKINILYNYIKQYKQTALFKYNKFYNKFIKYLNWKAISLGLIGTEDGLMDLN